MKYIFLLLFFLSHILYAQLVFTQEEKDFLKKHPIIKVHMEENYSPFSFRKDGEFTGFSIDFANLVADRLGVTFHYSKDEPWAEAIDNLKEKKIDIIAQMMNTKARREFALFSDDYMSYYQSIVVKKENSHLNALEKLNNKIVGVVTGYATAEPLKKYFPNIKLQYYKDTKAVVLAVMKGEIDAAISTHQVVQYILLSNYINDLISIPMVDNRYMPQIDEAYGIREDFKPLQSAIQKVFKQLEDEKRTLQIKWFGMASSNKEPIDKYSVLTKEEKAYLKSKTITYCIDPNWKPFEYLDENDHHSGLTRDYLDIIVKKTGMKTKLVYTKNWSETLGFLKSRKCDMMLVIAPTKSRKEYLLFTELYLKFPQIVATNEKAPFVSSMKDLLDKKVGIIKDYAIGEILKNKYPQFQAIEVQNTKDGLEQLAYGKIDAFIDFLPTVSRGITQATSGNLKIGGKIDEKVWLGIASRDDEPILNTILDKAIKGLTPQEHQSILDKWLTVKYEYGTDYSLVWKIVIGSFFIIAIIVYWNRRIVMVTKKLEKSNNLLASTKLELEQSNRELKRLATTDTLTKLYNRNKLDETLIVESSRVNRFNHSFGVVILDIDYFKNVNDIYGHQVGDSVLRDFANILKTHSRKTDIVGRWGGEEFLIICSETNFDGLLTLAQKLQENIKNHPFGLDEHITASFGVSMYQKGERIEEVIKRADDALYNAKKKGRNRVEFL